MSAITLEKGQQASGHHHRRGLFRNIGSNWLVLALGLAATYVLLPFTIRTLGQQQYGVWLLITSLTGYLGVLALGVPMASVRYLARDLAHQDHAAMNADIGTCAGLYLGMGIAALVIGSSLYIVFDRFYAVPPSLRGAGHVAFWLVVVYVAIGFFLQLPVGILNAHGDFVTANLILSSLWIVRFIVTVAAVYFYRTLVSLAVVQFALLMLQAGTMWIVIGRKYRYIRVRDWNFQWAAVRKIAAFSFFALVLNLSSRLSFETDALVIGRYMDIAQIPFYAVANSITLYLIEFIIGIAAVVMPLATRLEATSQYRELKDVYLKWSKIAFSLGLLAGIYVLLFGRQLMGWWIGPAFAKPSGEVLQILMFSTLIFLPARGVCLPVLMGMGKPVKATVAFLLSAVLNLVLSIVMVQPLGLAGVAWGTAIPSIGFGIAVCIFACQEVRVSLGEYLQYVVLRPVLGAIPVAVIMMAFQSKFDIHGVAGLSVAGITVVIVFTFMWLFFVYRKDRLLSLPTWVPTFNSR